MPAPIAPARAAEIRLPRAVANALDLCSVDLQDVCVMSVAHAFLPCVECDEAVPVFHSTLSRDGWAGVRRQDRGGLMKDLQELLQRKDLRSADRANMRTMLKKLQGGDSLNYQERVNLDAYVSRYTLGAKTSSQ
jgi:hypothetical protein